MIHQTLEGTQRVWIYVILLVLYTRIRHAYKAGFHLLRIGTHTRHSCTLMHTHARWCTLMHAPVHAHARSCTAAHGDARSRSDTHCESVTHNQIWHIIYLCLQLGIYGQLSILKCNRLVGCFDNLIFLAQYLSCQCYGFCQFSYIRLLYFG